MLSWLTLVHPKYSQNLFVSNVCLFVFRYYVYLKVNEIRKLDVERCHNGH